MDSWTRLAMTRSEIALNMGIYGIYVGVRRTPSSVGYGYGYGYLDAVREWRDRDSGISCYARLGLAFA